MRDTCLWMRTLEIERLRGVSGHFDAELGREVLHSW